jgi:FkbM family methyltransferase
MKKRYIKSFLKKFNLAITWYDKLSELRSIALKFEKQDLFFQLLNKSEKKLIENYKESKSQIGQDLFVISHLNFKKNGFFVEFGATNGIDLSNTYILEKNFEWKGILAEPAKFWHTDLKKNRHAHIETSCVFKTSGESLLFNEADDTELSTIDTYSNVIDGYKENRKIGKKYLVNTISLKDLLDKYNAPKNIDYLSIDTEGSEFEILSNFNFADYSIKIITCEHGYRPGSNKIYDLLIRNGYTQVYSEFSKWDYWFIKE